MKAYERFLKYVTFDTQSDRRSETTPSTLSQNLLGAYLVKELQELGVTDAKLDENGHVTGSVPATPGQEALPVLGFLAHMDTAEDASGTNINARIVKQYDGGDILLHEEKQIYLRPADYANLHEVVGQDLIVTDGTTLLGADDKAGIAEIMTLAQELLAHPERPHGTIKIAFTPDEEVGRGTDHFDVAAFGADFAYTVDGGELGEIEYENFNAAEARVRIHGISIHPGSSKNAMVNASLLGMEFHAMLPVEQNPRYTEGYEGFFHLCDFEGKVELAAFTYIIRDHDAVKFQEKKDCITRIAAYLNQKYGAGTVELTILDSYSNMKAQIEPHMHLIENAKKAFAACGVEPKVIAIRGGTDGARLSYMGLPCPNLSTGGLNFHGRFEYIPVQSLEKMSEILVKLASI